MQRTATRSPQLTNCNPEKRKLRSQNSPHRDLYRRGLCCTMAKNRFERAVGTHSSKFRCNPAITSPLSSSASQPRSCSHPSSKDQCHCSADLFRPRDNDLSTSQRLHSLPQPISCRVSGNTSMESDTHPTASSRLLGRSPYIWHGPMTMIMFGECFTVIPRYVCRPSFHVSLSVAPTVHCVKCPSDGIKISSIDVLKSNSAALVLMPFTFLLSIGTMWMSTRQTLGWL